MASDARYVWRFHSSDAMTARASRRALVGHLAEHTSGDEEGLALSELVIGELLANTVEHAPGQVEVEVDWSAGAPRLTVRDQGPGFETHRPTLPDDPLAEGGRGLFLVRTLAPDLRVTRGAHGTHASVTLPLAPRLRAVGS